MQVHKFFLSFLLLWTALFVGNIANIYLVEKNWALLVDLFKVKNNILLYRVHSANKWKDSNNRVETVILNKTYFVSNCHPKKRPYIL